MCVDYTDFNKACLKDSYPLYCINQLVDVTASHDLIQIRMIQKDREHTSFITNQDTYCYQVVPFKLKNTGVYVDDIIIKSKLSEDILSFNICFNPTKCPFGVSLGKFLRFIVHRRRIDANLEKVRSIQEMHPPQLVREV